MMAACLICSAYIYICVCVCVCVCVVVCIYDMKGVEGQVFVKLLNTSKLKALLTFSTTNLALSASCCAIGKERWY